MNKKLVAVAWAFLVALCAPFAQARPSLSVSTSSGFVALGGKHSLTRSNWSPGWFSGLSLWLMADVGVTSSGGLVSAWADQSGNGNNASASSTARPTLTSSVIGSYPALRCDGVANVMSVASAANLNMGQGSFDVFAVVVPRKIGAFQVIVGKTTNSAADNLRWFVNNANQPQTFWGGGASAYPGATGTPTASGTAGMLEWGLGASAQQVRYAVGVSSGVVNSITLSGTGSNSLAMGICSDSGTPFFSQYDVTEIVIYKAFYMGVSERGQIVQYFISKYGASIAR